MYPDNTARQLDDKLRCEILSHPELPTPPGIAVRLIDLAQSSDADFQKVEDLVKLDPAIAGKLMRLANSSYHTRGRNIETLKEAIGRFGLNGTVSIALSFSLIKTPKNTNERFGYDRHWLRSLASATICKRLSELCSAGSSEVFYLAALLQDIGVLALVNSKPQLYEQSAYDGLSHQQQIDAEIAEFGVDHSVVGSWLLESWKFPQQYVDATLTSHNLAVSANQSDLPMLSACVAVSSCLADLWKMPTIDFPAELEYAITKTLKLNEESIHCLLLDTEAEISEIAQVYGLKQPDDLVISSIINQAKDTITLRMLSAELTLTDTKQQLKTLEVRAEQLEQKLEFDDLTGVRTRAFIFSTLEEAFSSDVNQQTPIALLFVDLDDFKKINDKHGHRVGDEVLKYSANVLQEAVSENGIVARVGGEEFIVLLLNTGYDKASTVCENIVEGFKDSSIKIDESTSITMTASIGLSIHNCDSEDNDMNALIEAADAACYRAKTTGKNRWVF